MLKDYSFMLYFRTYQPAFLTNLCLGDVVWWNFYLGTQQILFFTKQFNIRRPFGITSLRLYLFYSGREQAVSDCQNLRWYKKGLPLLFISEYLLQTRSNCRSLLQFRSLFFIILFIAVSKKYYGNAHNSAKIGKSFNNLFGKLKKTELVRSMVA